MIEQIGQTTTNRPVIWMSVILLVIAAVLASTAAHAGKMDKKRSQWERDLNTGAASFVDLTLDHADALMSSYRPGVNMGNLRDSSNLNTGRSRNRQEMRLELDELFSWAVQEPRNFASFVQTESTTTSMVFQQPMNAQNSFIGAYGYESVSMFSPPAGGGRQRQNVPGFDTLTTNLIDPSPTRVNAYDPRTRRSRELAPARYVSVFGILLQVEELILLIALSVLGIWMLSRGRRRRRFA